MLGAECGQTLQGRGHGSTSQGHLNVKQNANGWQVIQGRGRYWWQMPVSTQELSWVECCCALLPWQFKGEPYILDVYGLYGVEFYLLISWVARMAFLDTSGATVANGIAEGWASRAAKEGTSFSGLAAEPTPSRVCSV